MEVKTEPAKKENLKEFESLLKEDFKKRDDKSYMTHTLAWQKGNEVKIAYRPVHAKTLTNDVQYFPPKERVY